MSRIGARAARRGLVLALALALSQFATDGNSRAATVDYASAGQARAAALALPIRPRAESRAVVRVSDNETVWFINRRDRRVKVHGTVGSEEDRKTILGMIKANMPDAEIDDRMNVAPRPTGDDQSWLGAVSFAIVQLGHIRRGSVALNRTALTIEGEARSADSYGAIENALTSLPNNVTLRQASVHPPVAKPFTWSAQFENGTLVLAGNVLNETSRADILRHVAELFPRASVTDRMEVAAGAPGKWSVVVASALSHLVRLEEGRVTLSETALTIEGVARDSGAAEAIATSLRGSLPKEFESTESIRHSADAPTSPTPGAPRPVEESSARGMADPSRSPPDAPEASPWIARWFLDRSVPADI